MLGWIKIYDRAHQRPKIEKTRGKYLDSSFETKPIRTALQFLREQEIVHPSRPSIRQFDFSGADNWYIMITS